MALQPIPRQADWLTVVRGTPGGGAKVVEACGGLRAVAEEDKSEERSGAPRDPPGRCHERRDRRLGRSRGDTSQTYL
jgi:hypothetical protein